MTKEDLEQELRAANANRAIFYYLVFDEMRTSHGEAEATRVMRAAIYRRGREMAADIRQFAPDRIKALVYLDAFVPEDGHEPCHIDMMWPLWNALDLTPEGRGEDWYPALKY